MARFRLIGTELIGPMTPHKFSALYAQGKFFEARHIDAQGKPYGEILHVNPRVVQYVYFDKEEE